MDFTNTDSNIFFDVIENIIDLGFSIIDKDFNRPWGGFLVIDESQIDKFIKLFFPNLDFNNIDHTLKYSPKILIIAPRQRLSWQYHHRRTEFWHVLKGTVQAVISDTDIPNMTLDLVQDDFLLVPNTQRHRLIGTNQWAIVAEIWQHTDPSNPSDESDIIRLQDDHGRASEFINIAI